MVKKRLALQQVVDEVHARVLEEWLVLEQVIIGIEGWWISKFFTFVDFNRWWRRCTLALSTRGWRREQVSI